MTSKLALQWLPCQAPGVSNKPKVTGSLKNTFTETERGCVAHAIAELNGFQARLRTEIEEIKSRYIDKAERQFCDGHLREGLDGNDTRQNTTRAKVLFLFECLFV